MVLRGLAVILITRTLILHVPAVIQKPQTAVFRVLTVILKLQTLILHASAVIQKTRTAVFRVLTVILKLQTLILHASAVIQKPRTVVFRVSSEQLGNYGNNLFNYNICSINAQIVILFIAPFHSGIEFVIFRAALVNVVYQAFHFLLADIFFL